MGSCLTLTNPTTTSTFKFTFVFEVSKLHDLRIHFHNPGEQFWFYLYIFPMDMPAYSLKVQGDPTISFMDIKLRVSVKILQNTKRRPCSHSISSIDYVECVKSKVVKSILESQSLNCTTVFTNFLHKWPLGGCSSRAEALEAYNVTRFAFYEVMRDRESSGCAIPCNQTVYSASLTDGNAINDSQGFESVHSSGFFLFQLTRGTSLLSTLQMDSSKLWFIMTHF